MNFAIFFRQKFPERWKDMVAEANHKYLDVPGPLDEVNNIIKQVDKGKYSYKCKEDPISSVCNKGLCMNRTFGVKCGDSDVNVILDGVMKCVNPLGGRPQFYLNINGLHRIMLETCDILFDQKKFTTLVFEETNITMNIVKQQDWRDRIREITERMEVVELPMDETAEGLFLIYLTEFIEENSKNVSSLEEIVNGRVFIDPEGGANFSRHIFFEFLNARKFSSLTRTKMNEVLKVLGTTSEKKHFGEVFRNFIRVPLKSLPNSIQSQPLPTPDVKPKF